MGAKLERILGKANPEGHRRSSERNARHICVNQWRTIAFYPAFQKMIEKRKEDNRKAAAARKASSAIGQGQPSEGQRDQNWIVGKCITCSKSFQRLKYSRQVPEGFLKCRCSSPHYFCNSQRCAQNFRHHMGMEVGEEGEEGEEEEEEVVQEEAEEAEEAEEEVEAPPLVTAMEL